MADDLVLLNDLSIHQAVSPPFKAMHENGVEMAFPKISMGFGIDARAEQHITAARKDGMPVGGYHWIDPTSTPARQGGHCVSMMEKHKLTHLMIDDEQSWINWQKYYDYINKKITWDLVPKASIQQLQDALLGTVEWITSRVPDLRWLLYSGYYFLKGYHKLNPVVVDFYKKAPARVWAEYDDSALGRRRLTWDQLRTLAAASRLDSRLQVPENARGPEDDPQQFTSSVIVPGYAVNMDFTRWKRSGFEAWSGQKPVEYVPFLGLAELEQDRLTLELLKKAGLARADGTVPKPS